MNKATKSMLALIAGIIIFFSAFWLMPDGSAGRVIMAVGGALLIGGGLVGYFGSSSSGR